MSSLRIPSPFLWKEFAWLFSQMGNWTIWCYLCMQCKSKYHKRDWQTAQIAPPILQIYWVFPRASVHHGNLFSSRVLFQFASKKEKKKEWIKDYDLKMQYFIIIIYLILIFQLPKIVQINNRGTSWGSKFLGRFELYNLEYM